jgi:polyisoprenoid-binding protein YceI
MEDFRMKRFALVALVVLTSTAALLAQATQPPTPPPATPGQAQPQGQRPPQPPLGPNQWRIDASHSGANFSVRHNVVSTVRGQLGRISGTIEYDGKDIKSVKADVEIDVTAINTANQGRDNDLRSANFFDVATHPTMKFVSKRVEPVSDGKFKLVGDLTMKGVTKEVVLDVEGPAKVMKSQRGILTGATATTKIIRQDFGLTYNRMIESLPVVSDEVMVTIDLELTRPSAPGTTLEAK